LTETPNCNFPPTRSPSLLSQFALGRSFSFHLAPAATCAGLNDFWTLVPHLGEAPLFLLYICRRSKRLPPPSPDRPSKFLFFFFLLFRSKCLWSKFFSFFGKRTRSLPPLFFLVQEVWTGLVFFFFFSRVGRPLLVSGLSPSRRTAFPSLPPAA